MARPLRIERPGAWYHVTGRGLERRRLFLDDRDRRRWLALLGEAVPRWRLRVYAYAGTAPEAAGISVELVSGLRRSGGGPAWLECQGVLELAGKGRLADQQRQYRRYVEEALREGLAESPWEQLPGQLVLGSQQTWDTLSKTLRRRVKQFDLEFKSSIVRKIPVE